VPALHPAPLPLIEFGRTVAATVVYPLEYALACPTLALVGAASALDGADLAALDDLAVLDLLADVCWHAVAVCMEARIDVDLLQLDPGAAMSHTPSAAVLACAHAVAEQVRRTLEVDDEVPPPERAGAIVRSLQVTFGAIDRLARERGADAAVVLALATTAALN
jgi:hypothetical protein